MKLKRIKSTIKELPIGIWSDSYKEFLESITQRFKEQK